MICGCCVKAIISERLVFLLRYLRSSRCTVHHLLLAPIQDLKYVWAFPKSGCVRSSRRIVQCSVQIFSAKEKVRWGLAADA